VQSIEQSVWLNQDHTMKIILAGSGMAIGGRVRAGARLAGHHAGVPAKLPARLMNIR